MILLKNVTLDGRDCNILVDGNRFKDIDAPANVEGAEVVDCSDLAIVPAFYNAHAHNAMTLLRGYADDIALSTWLNDYIWPYEAKMTAGDIRRGSQIAADEMIRTGSVAMNDMYFDIEETIDVMDKSGLRALIGITVMDNHSKAESEAKRHFVREWKDPTGGRIKIAMAPHSVYTVSTENLKNTAAFARDNGLKLHIHLCETAEEVSNCIKTYGTTPVRYLESIGFLGSDVIAAHCVHVDKEEWDILAKRGVTVVNCPCSNMKIASGRFPYEMAIASGTKVSLGTDGCCSNNNLDMREEMKFAALLAKVVGDPTLLPAKDVLDWATRGGAEAMGFDAGVIAAGKLADFILLNKKAGAMCPCHNIISNWVYAADSAVIDSVYCDGKRLG